MVLNIDDIFVESMGSLEVDTLLVDSARFELVGTVSCNFAIVSARLIVLTGAGSMLAGMSMSFDSFQIHLEAMSHILHLK